MPPHQNPTCCSNINTNHQPLLSVLSNWLSRLLNYASLKFQRFNILYRLCQGIHDDVNTIRKSRREVSSNIRCHFFDNFRCSIWLPPLWLYPTVPTEHSYEGREERSTWGVSSSVPVLSATRLQHDCVEK